MALCLGLALSLMATLAPSTVAGKSRGMSGTMAVEGGAVYATSQSVTVASSVAGATQLRLQNAGQAWSAWSAYEAVRPWTLSAGDGEKTVTVQYRNSSGKTLTLSDAIVLDATPPATGIIVARPWATLAVVTLSASDALSGVADTLYRVDGGTWRSGTNLLLSAGHKRSRLGTGPHTVDYYSIDGAGNAEVTQSLVVTL